MRLKAIHAIRYNGTRLRAGSVFELPDDLTAQTLIAQGHAAATSEKLHAVTETRVPTEELLQEATGRGRGRSARIPRQ